MAEEKDFAQHVAARLTPLGAVVPRAMFGGYGIYLDGVMFGLIASEKLYLKVDAETKPRFDEAGSRPFTYQGKKRPVEMSYWSLPQDAWSDPDSLLAWGRLGLAAARRAAAAKRRRKDKASA